MASIVDDTICWHTLHRYQFRKCTTQCQLALSMFCIRSPILPIATLWGLSTSRFLWATNATYGATMKRGYMALNMHLTARIVFTHCHGIIICICIRYFFKAAAAHCSMMHAMAVTNESSTCPAKTETARAKRGSSCASRAISVHVCSRHAFR